MPKVKNNKLIIAAAGSGKTEYIVRQSMEILKSNPNARVLITTYTIENELELKQRFLKINKYIPKNIIIQTYFSFLIQHGIRPYKWYTLQSDYDIKGMVLVSGKSAPKIDMKTGKQVIIKDKKTGKDIPLYWGEEENIYKHFFNSNHDIYSDKIAKFTIRCNEKSNGAVVARLEEIYTYIFIDEVQDLAGYDLDLVKLLLKSNIQTTMVGDPRQTVYLTHHEAKFSKYQNGKIDEFITNECNKICKIDTTTLQLSHRNNQQICDFANKLYPSLEATKPCECQECKINDAHLGVYLIRQSDVNTYLEIYGEMCVQLRYSEKTTSINPQYEVYNFGQSKGKTFDRVLIYPTNTIIQYLKDGQLTIKKARSKGKVQEGEAFDIAKFYVAVTRAKYSVVIVCDNIDNKQFSSPIEQWIIPQTLVCE